MKPQESTIRSLMAEREHLRTEIESIRKTFRAFTVKNDAHWNVVADTLHISFAGVDCDASNPYGNAAVVKEAVDKLRATCEESERLASRLANDALVALSGIVCTPAEGYLKAPHCLKGDIGSLRARCSLAEASLEESCKANCAAVDALKAAEKERDELSQRVCDCCNGDGWQYNRVEGRGACVCMTEMEPFQILLNALERIAKGECKTGASWSEAMAAIKKVLPLDHDEIAAAIEERGK